MLSNKTKNFKVLKIIHTLIDGTISEIALILLSVIEIAALRNAAKFFKKYPYTGSSAIIITIPMTATQLNCQISNPIIASN